jgi:hypothetical protein
MMPHNLPRRDFLKLVGVGAMAAAIAPPATPATSIPIPMGKIGNLELSRLMLGTNHITFYMHSRDLRYVRDLSQRYNTDEKIIETFAAAEANGVNTFVTHSESKIEKLFKQFRDRHNSKMKWIVAPWLSDDGRVTDPAGYGRLVPKLVESGVDALYVPGMLAEPLIRDGKGAIVADLLEVIKASGVPTGISSHSLNVVRFCEKEKLPVDFYVKTFHHLKYPTAPKPETITAEYAEVPGFWCSNPEETTEFMKGVAKPWIAFKVMAAGAIPPRDAFRYAFTNGADFILAGMFDFQMAEDAQICRDTLASIKSRPRPWRG